MTTSFEPGVLTFLTQQQQPNGSFLSFSSSDPLHFQNARSLPTTFFSSLILSALASLPQTSSIQAGLIQFLLSQKSETGSFNYWVRHSPETQKFPYPDDLDDTFCALSALSRARPSLITGEVLAQSVKLLTKTERAAGGPYRTWLVSKQAPAHWQDYDLAVNSNIGFFLQLQQVRMPGLIDFVEAAIRQDMYVSPYYPTCYPVLYFMCRFYQGELKEGIVRYLLKAQTAPGIWENPLHTSLAVSSLAQLGVMKGLKESRRYLLQNLHGDHWDAFPFCLDPSHQGQHQYAGSPALTTALCLEALAVHPHPLPTTVPRPLNHIRTAIVVRVEARINQLEGELKRLTARELDKVLQKDQDQQVTLLPYLFKQALGERGESIPDSVLIQAGSASVWGWLAYGLYDDFLDQEGQTPLLPVANLALRESFTLFATLLPENTHFQQVAAGIFDKMEAANTWEALHCRVDLFRPDLDLRSGLPDYQDYHYLAERSLGHTLAPLSLLFFLQESEIDQFLLAFQHFLIARQLHDDAHDWQADLERGQLNAVGTWLLKKNNRKKLQIPPLQSLFWHAGLPHFSREICRHLQKSRAAFKKVKSITNRRILEDLLLIPLEQIAERTLQEQNITTEFLQFYNQCQ